MLIKDLSFILFRDTRRVMKHFWFTREIMPVYVVISVKVLLDVSCFETKIKDQSSSWTLSSTLEVFSGTIETKSFQLCLVRTALPALPVHASFDYLIKKKVCILIFTMLPRPWKFVRVFIRFVFLCCVYFVVPMEMFPWELLHILPRITYIMLLVTGVS